jgi:hypothetical protein
MVLFVGVKNPGIEDRNPCESGDIEDACCQQDTGLEKTMISIRNKAVLGVLLRVHFQPLVDCALDGFFHEWSLKLNEADIVEPRVHDERLSQL